MILLIAYLLMSQMNAPTWTYVPVFFLWTAHIWFALEAK